MKSKHEDINEHIELSKNAIRAGNSTLALEHATQACRLAIEYNDTLWYDYARLGVAISYNMQQKYSLSMPIYPEIWESIEKNFPVSDVLQMYASYSATCGDTGDMQNALLWAHKGIELAQAHGLDRQLMNLSFSAATAYDRLHYYSRSMSVLETILSLAKKLNDNRFLAAACTLYAVALVEVNEKELGIEYYNKALNIALDNNDYRRAAVILHNLSLLNPDNDSAEKFEDCKRALEVARKSDSVRYTAGALASMGDWYLYNNQTAEAEKYYMEVLDVAQKADETYSHWMGHYRLAKLYLNKGEYDTARKHLQTATTFLQQVVLDFQIRDTYELWYNLEKSCANSLEALEWHEKLSDLERKMAQKKQEETAKAVLIVARVDELRKQLAQEEQKVQKLTETQEQQAREVVTLSLELEEKKTALKKIKKIATESIKSNTSKPAEQKSAEKIEHYLRNLSTDEHSWDTFKEGLERMHPEFIQRLLQKHPELSPMQIRICCLLRLQLPTKEIADILKLSQKTIENHRMHIRVKFKIPRNVNIVSYILNL